MKKISVLASLLPVLTSMICAGVPALAQDFLNPVTPQAPVLGNGALNSGGALGNLSNSSNLLTGPGANLQQMGRSFAIQKMQNGLLAPASVNTGAFPSGQYNYGFSQPGAFSFNPFSGPNQNGSYGGTSLPTVSTGSVDINTVDCPYLRESYGTGSQIVNPLSLNLNIPGLGNLNLQETPQGAMNFLQDSFDSLGSLW